MTKHIMEAPPPLVELQPELPDEVCALIHEMLGKSQQERPSMAQVVTRLEQLLEAQQSVQSSEWRSMHRPAKKAPQRTIPALLLIGAFVVGTGSLVGVGLYRRAHSSKRNAAVIAQTTPPAAADKSAAPKEASGITGAAPVLPPSAPAPLPSAAIATGPAGPPSTGEDAGAGPKVRKKPVAARSTARKPSAPASSAGAASSPAPAAIPVFR